MDFGLTPEQDLVVRTVRDAKSISCTRKWQHSFTRSPAPYMSAAMILDWPFNPAKILAISSRVGIVRSVWRTCGIGGKSSQPSSDFRT